MAQTSPGAFHSKGFSGSSADKKEDKIASYYAPSSFSSMKELREANAALQHEISSLQHAAREKATFAQSQVACLNAVRAEACAAAARHQEADEAHHAHIRNLTKKLKEEAAGRAASEALLTRHRTNAAEVAPHMASAAAALTSLRQARRQLEVGLASEKEAAQELQRHGAALTIRLRNEEALRQRCEADIAAALALVTPVVGAISDGSSGGNGSSAIIQQAPLVGAVKQLVERLNSALASAAESRDNIDKAISSAQDTRRMEAREHKAEVDRLHNEIADLQDAHAAISTTAARDQKALQVQKQLVSEAEQCSEERRRTIDRLTAQLDTLQAEAQAQQATTQGLEASLKRAEAASVAQASKAEKECEAAAAAREAAATSERQCNEALAAMKQSQLNEESALKRVAAAEAATKSAQADVDSLRSQLYDLRTKMDTAQLELQQCISKNKGLEDAIKKATAEAEAATSQGAHKADKLQAALEDARSQLADTKAQLSEVSAAKRTAEAAAQRAEQQAKEAGKRAEESSAQAKDAKDAAERLHKEVSAANEAHKREAEHQARMLSDTLEAVQQEEAFKNAALSEVRSLHQALDQAQAATQEAEEGRRAAEDAAASQTAALAATKRRADTYREENRALLSNYDGWLRTLVSAKGGSPAAAAQLKLPTFVA